MARTEVDQDKLQKLVAGIKELPPKIRRETRRDLRHVGDGVIAAMRDTLSGPLPAGVRKTGQTTTAAVRRRNGRFYAIRRNTYGATEVKSPGRSTGMREAIKAGLKTRVSTSVRYQGVDIKTTGPRHGKFNMAKVWNLARFRHPVFGREAWVYQSGQPFFFEPVRAGYDDMVKRVEEILTRTTNEF